MPALYIPHGGGPCFFMEWTYGPRDTWDRMAAFLRALPGSLPRRPSALLVVSAHWEATVPTVLDAPAPPLLFDYHGFPPHTYALRWPAPGSPPLASEVRGLLEAAGIPSAPETRRGFDHGVFVPMLLAYPDADVPTVQLSLQVGLDPAAHLAIGRALAPLRDEDVLIVGSGMSYHEMRARRDVAIVSGAFDAWLNETVTSPREARERGLVDWVSAPHARDCHPRSEHLAPLFVVAGAAGDGPGRRVYGDRVLGAAISAFAFD